MNKGFILVLVLLITSLLFLLAVGLHIQSTTAMKAAMNEQDYITAFNHAEGGIAIGKEIVREHCATYEDFTELLRQYKAPYTVPLEDSNIQVWFFDNYDDAEFGTNRPYVDTDCRIQIRAIAKYPPNTLHPTVVEIRARFTPEGDEDPCTRNVRMTGWEEMMEAK